MYFEVRTNYGINIKGELYCCPHLTHTRDAWYQPQQQYHTHQVWCTTNSILSKLREQYKKSHFGQMICMIYSHLM